MQKKHDTHNSAIGWTVYELIIISWRKDGYEFVCAIYDIV